MKNKFAVNFCCFAGSFLVWWIFVWIILILHEIIVFLLLGSNNRKFGFCWSQKRCDWRMVNLFWRTDGCKLHSVFPKKKTWLLTAGSFILMFQRWRLGCWRLEVLLCGLGTNFKFCRWVFHICIFSHFFRLVSQWLFVWKSGALVALSPHSSPFFQGPSELIVDY